MYTSYNADCLDEALSAGLSTTDSPAEAGSSFGEMVVVPLRMSSARLQSVTVISCVANSAAGTTVTMLGPAATILLFSRPASSLKVRPGVQASLTAPDLT